MEQSGTAPSGRESSSPRWQSGNRAQVRHSGRLAIGVRAPRQPTLPFTRNERRHALAADFAAANAGTPEADVSPEPELAAGLIEQQRRREAAAHPVSGAELDGRAKWLPTGTGCCIARAIQQPGRLAETAGSRSKRQRTVTRGRLPESGERSSARRRVQLRRGTTRARSQITKRLAASRARASRLS
jgi:hypothetical protein